MKDMIPVGTAVHVRDGTPQPPARFNRKLRDWKNRNYDAVVVGHREPDRWNPVPTYRLQSMGFLTGIIRVFRDGKAEQVTPIEGARTYPITGEGSFAMVDEKGL